ncbi:MAG: sigma-70 family RNA polymerase sigma factor [Acidobacteriota bacterium]
MDFNVINFAPNDWLLRVIMAFTGSQDLTQLLQAWSDGDEAALEKLAPLVQAELHRLAKAYMRREHPGHTLQPTALVNEAYMRLIDWKNARWQNRAHFFGVSAKLMRRILVDFARARPKAGENTIQHLSLDDALGVGNEQTAEVLALDDALHALEKLDPRKSQIVELRFFGGLSVEETAEVLKISERTVMREWEKARVWLYRELKR